MSSWPKIIRDPVHNIVPFEGNDCDKLLLDLINTKEFQRLRRIKQLGLSQLVFPGADHSRFAHSIGVMHMARRILERIRKTNPGSISEDQRTAVLVAALLHDVGHGPFSHAFEAITEDKHEARTCEIISSGATDVNRVLREANPNLPNRLMVFFDENLDDDAREGAEIPAYLTQVVSSQLDADRFDYLLRDNLATGAEYGRFDVEWMLEHLHVDSEKGRFYLGQKALYAAETYVLARYHMYRSVYYHKTTRAAEVMLRLLFRRYKACLDAAGSETTRKEIVPTAPPAVYRAFSEAIPLEDYLLLDDHSLTEFAKACTKCDDNVLVELADGLLNRRLFKATDVTETLGTRVARYTERAKQILTEAGCDPEFAFADDTPGDTAYKLYNPDAEKPATQIYIETAGGVYKELSERSESIRPLTKPYTLQRYYYPSVVRDRIKTEAEPLLFKE